MAHSGTLGPHTKVLGSNPVVCRRKRLQGELCFKTKKKRSSLKYSVLPSSGERGTIKGEGERERALFRLWSVSMREGSKFRVLVWREREKSSGYAFWI
jgi:hypothetical protein